MDRRCRSTPLSLTLSVCPASACSIRLLQLAPFALPPAQPPLLHPLCVFFLGVEFDNMYLDMNNIIHPCCHPEDRAPPENEEAMMEAIFAYIDRLFALVRPRRLLYMAVDGK